jgi:aryl-alcohol dehydrogenase-like predicted oxidoreductase
MMRRIGLDYIDCCLVHGHIHLSSISEVARSLKECVDSGMTKAVGVSNYLAGDTEKMQAELAQYNIPLARKKKANCRSSAVTPKLPVSSRLYRENNIVFHSSPKDA